VLRRPHIPLLQEDNTRKGFFERAQFESVRAHLPAPLRGVATFAYCTGWRTTSEILPLQWHQVDLAAGTVRLEPGSTKNREGRLFLFGQLVELRPHRAPGAQGQRGALPLRLPAHREADSHLPQSVDQ
jgi:integrase